MLVRATLGKKRKKKAKIARLHTGYSVLTTLLGIYVCCCAMVVLGSHLQRSHMKVVD